MTTTPVAPTVAAYTDAGPSPRIDITLPSVPVDARTFTFYRVAAGEITAVRGTVDAPSASPIATDFEAPFGTDITYFAITKDVAGTPSAAGPLSVVVRLDVDDMWLSDPLAPRTSLPVDLCLDGETVGLTDTFREITYAGVGQVITVIGSALPFGVSGVRQEASDMPLEFMTTNPSAGATLRALVADAFPLLVRLPAVFSFLPGGIYLAVGDLIERPQRTVTPLAYDRSRWEMTGTRVRPPGASIIEPPRIWDDLPGEAATWADLAVRYATWNAVARGV